MSQPETRKINAPSITENVTVYRWLVLAMNTALQGMQSLISTSTGVLAPFIIADLGLTKSMIGFAGGAVHIGMGFTAILAGRLTDKHGEKIVLILGGILAGLAIILTSRSASFFVFVALLLLTGILSAGATPAGSKAIVKWFPPEKQGLALGIRQTGVTLGGFTGSLLLPFIALNWNWRLALVTAGIIFILGCIGFFFTYKSKPADQQPAQDKKTEDSIDKWSFLNDSNIWFIMAVAILYQGAQYIMITYLALYVRDTLNVSVATAALCLTATQLGGMSARIGLGYVSDTLLRGARKPILVIQGFVIIFVALTLLTFNEHTPLWLALIVSWFFGMSAMGWNGLYVALLTKTAGQARGGAAVGLGVSMIQIGTFCFPPLFGLMIDLSGSYFISWSFLAAMISLGMLLFLKIHEPAHP